MARARVPLATAGGAIIALAILGLAAFYLLRGEMSVAEKPGERRIERFSPLDRWAHWLLAITWVTLAVTGIILSLGKAVLLPLIGYTLFSWLAIVVEERPQLHRADPDRRGPADVLPLPAQQRRRRWTTSSGS